MTNRIIAILEARYPGESFRLCPESTEDFVGTNGVAWTTYKTRRGLAIPEMIERDGLSVRRLAEHPLRGYPNVSVRRGRFRRGVPVYRLVLETFVGPCPEGMQGCHFPDRDKSNNHLDNLRWDTSAGNHADMVIHGTILAGERNGFASMTEGQVREACRLRLDGMSIPDVARAVGASAEAIRQALKGKSWKHLTSSLLDDLAAVKTDQSGEKNSFSKLTCNQVVEIRQRLARGEQTKDVARRFSVTPTNIRNIKKGKTWSHVI